MLSGPAPLPPRRLLPLLLALLLPALPAAAASYPPELRFRTLSSGRADVHFHEGFEAMARQAGALVDEILPRHEARYGRCVGRVQLVIVDAEDSPNGFASPLPYPLVSIRAVAPDGADDFGNHEGWLRLVLTHELAHTVHLEQARGLWGFGRRVFGRAPFLFPNTLAMSWMIEGLATYEETEATAFGRGRNPDSQMVVRMAALEGPFPSEDQAIYGLDAWPGGQAPYLFGESFLRRLSAGAGEDALPRMARQHSGQFPPWLDGRTTKKVTGTGLSTQWRAWEQQVRDAARSEADARSSTGLTASSALTARGVRQASPRFSPDAGWVAYASRTLTRFPEIRLVRPDGSEDRRLTRRNGGSGLAWTPDGREVVFGEVQVHRTFSVFGDLSAADASSGRVRRLTRGVRAYDPDVSPDGRRVVFARKCGDRSELYTVGIDGRGLERLTTSAEGVEWSGPRWAPAGTHVVAARLLPGGWLDLVRVDAASGSVEQLTHDRAKDVEPTFTPDGETVVFRSDRDGVSNLYALRLRDRALARVTNVLGGAFQPSVSPDGASVVFSEYSGGGYDVRRAPLQLSFGEPPSTWVDTLAAPRPEPAPADGAVRPYRAWAMLLPRFWSPWLELEDDDQRYGIASGGSDALFRHIWGGQLAYGTGSDRLNGRAFYVYDRFRPTLLATARDTTDVVRDGLVRTQSVNLQASVPVRRSIRAVQSLSLTWRREREQVLGSPLPEDRLDLGGVESAWAIASARSYPFSVSPSEGGRLQLAWLHEARALGSDLSLDKLTAEGRWYQRVFGARDVLALRAAGGTTHGQPLFERSFAVGGYPSASLFDIVETNEAVLRGYPDDAFNGRSFASTSVEYRFPLLSPQRGWRSLPVFLRHLRGTVFFDAAHAWSHGFELEDVKTGAGAAIGVDTALGFALPATAELSVARGFDERGDTRVYLRFGLAF